MATFQHVGQLVLGLFFTMRSMHIFKTTVAGIVLLLVALPRSESDSCGTLGTPCEKDDDCCQNGLPYDVSLPYSRNNLSITLSINFPG